MSRNNRRYNNNNNNNNTFEDGTPKGWRNFTEIRFKVSGIPTYIKELELRNQFSKYGSVHRIEIEANDDDESKGVAYVTFKPVPDYPFWAKQVHINRKLIKMSYDGHSTVTFVDQADGKTKLRFYSFPATCLEMGGYQDPNTFVSEVKYTELIDFTINYQRRCIIIQFNVKFDQNSYTFKLETAFKDVDGDFHVVLENTQRGPIGTIMIASKFPAKYWVLDNRFQSKDNFNWCYDDSWKRKTEIRVTPKSLEEKQVPLQPNMPDKSDRLGKWIVFKLTFNLDMIGDKPLEGVRRFKDMIKLSKDYNLVSKDVNIEETNPLHTIDVTNLRDYVNHSSMLSFSVLYMLECNISFNYLHNYNVNENFIMLLSRLPSQVAIHILERIYSRKKRIYDPYSYLRSELDFMRSKNIDVEPKYVPSHCVMMRKVVISPTTMYFLPPSMETSNRVIRRFRDKMDNFLRIQFVDEASGKVSSSNGTNNYALYNRIYHTLNYGIKIGDRHYEFLAFSSSQLRDHSCWFFASSKDLTADDIRFWMGDFTSIKNVAKYAARMGQCFSSTRAILDLPVNNIEEISDVVMNGFNFSDGIGKLSFSLASKISEKLELKYIPSAFQFRLAGYKGILCQSRYARGDQICVRPSQYKFESNHNILEVIRCSAFIPAYLNRQAITLLSTLGVPDNVFIEMKDLQVNELNKIFDDEKTAINLLQKNADEYGISRDLADLVKAGFLRTRDPYIMNLISLFRITMLRDLKKKAKIRVEKGAFLLGVLDETKSLKENEIYCCVTDPNGINGRKVITGTCIVFRNPCFHPGDIRVVTAVSCKNLNNLIDVVVFPATGYRDIPSQCSGGDLDGDDFTIIYDERLIPKKKNMEPMAYEAQKPDLVDNITMKDIQAFFVNYILSDQLGIIANSHLAKADFFDAGAFHGQCIRLAQLHSEAVDFPKTGKSSTLPSGLRASIFPDFMEKHDKPSYKSEKVLGIIYRSIKEEPFNPYSQMVLDDRLHFEGYKTYVEEARRTKIRYDADIMGLMNQYGVKTEFEVTSGYIINNISSIDRKKSRDITKSVMDAFIPIKRYYRKLFEEEFYGEGTNVVSPVIRHRMKAKAAAWYYVTYHPAELRDNPSERMISFAWIAHDVLCNIALGDTINNNQPNVKNKQKTKGRKSKSITIGALPKNDGDINKDLEVLRRSLG
ncbi:hypothetical protein RclHR1_01510011 [Rhizophagus clarus]|uniref:RNA-dependent RNA polymerase n=1 Tax=Rhizophagus clarus TaxID=94130 RepID=A0A2Z6QEE7_9GLOM|nr:hypothetical protein RclHR1_01510011 [Rhizophagus clarus]GET02552.1 RNA dependent RNA polymerase-domain-containing protein [Rhizophagus clarus]